MSAPLRQPDTVNGRLSDVELRSVWDAVIAPVLAGSGSWSVGDLADYVAAYLQGFRSPGEPVAPRDCAGRDDGAMSEMFCRECEPTDGEHEEGCSFGPQPGQLNAAVLKLAFWEAMKRCEDDDRVHAMDYPYHDDPKIDGDIPAVLWEHMAVAIAELRAAAGSEG